MQVRDNFKRGSVEMMILSLLSSRDLYGYEMSQLIEERGGGYIQIPEGSLYPTLYKLQVKNAITSYQITVKKNMHRIYYHITDSGRNYLEELKREFYMVNRTIQKIIEYEEE